MKTLEYYEKCALELSERYDAADSSRLHDFLMKYLPVRGRILEVACGSGRDALFLVKHGFEVTATDASREMIRIAAKKLEPFSKCMVQCVKFPLNSDNPLLSEKYNAIIATAVIMHFNDDELGKFAGQIPQMLSEDGRLILSQSKGRSGLDSTCHDNAGRLFCERSRGQLADIFEISGLRLIGFEESADSLGRSSLRWMNLAYEKT